MTETGGGAMLAASSESRHIGTRCIGFPGKKNPDLKIEESGELLVRRAGADPRRGFFSGYLKDEAATEPPGATAGVPHRRPRCSADPTARCTLSIA